MGTTYSQSGVVPYLETDEGLRLVLVTSNSGRWIFPKGLTEDDMTPWDSAAQEALEEGGLLGAVDTKPLATYQYEKWGGTCTVDMYPMKVDRLLAEWDESDVRERAVVPIDRAADLIDPRQAPVLDSVRKALG
jgi:8-oxo-dGTP pyrophosphatase MutT (NUDIX family)